MRYISGVILFVLLSVSLITYGRIAVSPSIVKFVSSESRVNNLQVSNVDDNYPAFVEVIVYKVGTNADASQYLSKLARPGAAGLLVAPTKFILKSKGAEQKARPGSYRMIRLSSTQAAGQIEKRYRVVVSPREAPVKIADNIGKQPGIRAGVRVLLSYGIVVSVLPKNPKSNLSIQRSGKMLTVKNTGNLFVRLLNGKQCNSKKVCRSINRDLFIAPKQTVAFSLPQALPVQFEKTTIIKQNEPLTTV